MFIHAFGARDAAVGRSVNTRSGNPSIASAINRFALARRLSAGLFVLALVLALAAISAARASAAYTIVDFKLTPSTTQAGGHPKTHYHVDPDATNADKTGGDDLKKVVIDYPAGLLGNPEAASPKCSATQFAADSCPSSSYIGSMTVKWRETSGIFSSASGSVYVLTPATVGSAITVGFVVRPSGRRKVFLKTEVTGVVTVRTGVDADYGLTLVVDNVPRTLTTTGGTTRNITVSDIAVDINPRANTSQTGKYFAFNPTRCTAANSRATISSYGGVVITKNSSFTPTGCSRVPFTPTASFNVTNKVAGQATGISATFSVPTADATIQQSHVQGIQVDLPSGTGLNFPAIGAIAALCSDAQLNADACPAGSQIGTVSANVPFLPPTMTGDVYLTQRSSSIGFGYVLRGANGVKAMLKGQSAAVDANNDGVADFVRTTTGNMPQAPWSTATINFTAPLINNPTNCTSPKSIASKITGRSGKVVSLSSPYGALTCPTTDTIPPVMTITSPADNSWTNASSVLLNYTATDNSGVAPTCNVANGSSVALVNGPNTISVTCTDGSGNATTASVHVTRDNTPPTVTITAPTSYPLGSSYTLVYTVTDDFDPSPTCDKASGSTQIIPISSGPITVAVTCTDRAGNAMTASNLLYPPYTTPPLVTITAPVNGLNTTASSVVLTYTATDALGAPATCDKANGSSIALVAGPNTITLSCTDPAGNTTTKSVTVIRDNVPPVITITAPINGSTVVGTSVTLTYTVTDNVTPTPTCNKASGSIQTLVYGVNVITVICTDNAGNGTSASVTVMQGGESWFPVITSPVNGSFTQAASVTLQYAPPPAGLGIFCNRQPGDVIALAAGSNTITVVCTDAAGNTVSATVTVFRDNTPPVISNAQCPRVANKCTLTYTVADNSGVAPTCTKANNSVQDLTLGPNVISFTCTDGAGNSASASVTVILPDDWDMVVISNVACGASPTANATCTLTFTAISGSGSALSCTKANNSVQNLAIGTNVITVTCANPFGSSGTGSVTVTRIGDTTAPVILNPTLSPPPPYFPGQVVTLTYGVSEPASCTPPSGSARVLQAGTNTFTITCTDASGNVGSVSFSIVISGSSLAVTITGGPANGGVTTDNTPTFTYVANQPVYVSQPCPIGEICIQVITPVIGFRCTVDGGAPVSCPATTQYGGSYTTPALSNAPHTFCVTAYFLNGSGQSTPDCRSFEVLNGPPVVTITSPADGLITNATSVTVTYTATDDSGVPPTCDKASGSTVPLVSGSNTIVVTCTDGAGNTGYDAVTVFRDAPPPVVTITSPANNLVTNSASITITYTVTVSGGGTATCNIASGSTVPLVAGSNTITVSCADSVGSVGSASVTVYRRIFNPSFTQYLVNPVHGQTTGLSWQARSSVDMHLLRIDIGSEIGPNYSAFGDASDMCPASSAPSLGGSGSWDASACPARAEVGYVYYSDPLIEPLDTRIFLIDASPMPYLGFAVVEGSRYGVGAMAPSIVQVDPNCDPSTTACEQTIRYSMVGTWLDGVDSVLFEMSGPARQKPDGTTLSGDLFRVQCATDDTITATATLAPLIPGGGPVERSSDTAISGCPGNDVTPPAVTITSPVDGLITNATSVTVTYTATDDSGVPPTCDKASGSTVPLVSGSNTIVVTCTDGAGNTGYDAVTVFRDAPPPVVTITSPANNLVTNSASITITYTVTVSGGGTATCNIASGSTVPLVAGNNTITVSCAESAGSVGSASVTVYRDNTSPTVTITSPADGSPYPVGALVVPNYTASDNQDTSLSCSGPPVTIVLGPNVITVSCTDNAGNVGSDSVTVYGVQPPPPDTSITSFANPSAGNPAAGASPTLNVAFTGNSSISFECRVDAGVFTPCSSPWTVPTSGLTSPAEHTYEVRAVNAGTPDATPAKGYFWYDDRTFNATATVTAVANSLEPTAADANDAGAHPNIEASLNLQGYDDPKSASVVGPDGLMGSLKSVLSTDRCMMAQADVGACPASAQIGTAVATAITTTDGTVTANGQIYLVDPTGLPSSDAAGVAVEFENITGSVTGNLGNVVARGGLRINDHGRNLRIVVDDIPRQTSNGVRFHLRAGTVTINGDKRPDMAQPASNANPPLLTNPHNCTSAAFTPLPGQTTSRPNWDKFVGTGTGYDNSTTPPVTATYTVDNCTATGIPFNPTTNYALSNANAGASTQLTANVSIPFDHSTTKAASVTLPPFLAVDTVAVGDSSADQCPVETIKNMATFGVTSPSYYYFDYENPTFPCPPQARVGSAIITTPLLDGPVKASVWLIEKAPIPNLGFVIDADTADNPQGVNIGLIGTTATVNYIAGCDPLIETCDQAVQTVLNSLPDVPLSTLDLTIGDQPGRVNALGQALPQEVLKIASAADSACRNAGDNLRTQFVAWRGGGVTRNNLLAPQGCNQ